MRRPLRTTTGLLSKAGALVVYRPIVTERKLGSNLTEMKGSILTRIVWNGLWMIT